MRDEVDWQFLAELLNRECEGRAEVVSADGLRSMPKREIGIEGWICEYSVFERGGEMVLALCTAHRMSNEDYCEYSAAGEMTFCFSSWGGFKPEGGYPEDYLESWKEACRRAKEAGVDEPSK